MSNSIARHAKPRAVRCGPIGSHWRAIEHYENNVKSRAGLRSETKPPPVIPLRFGAAYIFTIVLNPPQNMRLPSNGIFFGSMLAKRLSFITLALMRSRAFRDV